MFLNPKYGSRRAETMKKLALAILFVAFSSVMTGCVVRVVEPGVYTTYPQTTYPVGTYYNSYTYTVPTYPFGYGYYAPPVYYWGNNHHKHHGGHNRTYDGRGGRGGDRHRR